MKRVNRNTTAGIVIVGVSLAIVAFLALTSNGHDPDSALTERELIADEVAAQAEVRTAQTALEVLAVERRDSYGGVSVEELSEMSNVPAERLRLRASENTYSVSVDAEHSDNSFTVNYDRSDPSVGFQINLTCAKPGFLTCDSSGEWEWDPDLARSTEAEEALGDN